MKQIIKIKAGKKTAKVFRDIENELKNNERKNSDRSIKPVDEGKKCKKTRR